MKNRVRTYYVFDVIRALCSVVYAFGVQNGRGQNMKGTTAIIVTPILQRERLPSYWDDMKCPDIDTSQFGRGFTTTMLQWKHIDLLLLFQENIDVSMNM